MRERTRRPKESTTPDELDLATSSVPKSQREPAERTIDLVLAEIRQKWLDAQGQFEQSNNPEGIELAMKVQMLANALDKLSPSVLLHSSLEAIVRDIIVCEAGEGDMLKLSHPGNAYRAMLPLATYLNSSQRS